MRKKLLSIMLVIAMVLSFAACGGEGGSSEPEKTATPLVIGEKHTIEGYAEFSLFKIQTTEKIEASVDSTFSYNASDGNKYVDLVLDITNLGAETIEAESIVSVTATNASGGNYTCSTFIAESGNGTEIDAYATINPLASTRLHCATSVNNAEEAVQLTLTVNGQEYTYDYICSEIVRDAKTIAKGDVLEEEDFAKLEFKGAMYTDDLMPSNTSGFYTHYQVDSSENTYLVVKMNLTNYQSSGRNLESFVGVKATYMDKYTYDGFMVVEESDKAGFDSYCDLSPLAEHKAFVLIEVPKTVTENDAVIELSFAGQEYLYAYAAE